MNILRNVYAGIAEIFFKPFKNLGNKKVAQDFAMSKNSVYKNIFHAP